MDLAQGRASSYVTRDMGAMESLRWHASHFSWKIGAMSLVKVTGLAASAEVLAGSAAVKATDAASNAPEVKKTPTWDLLRVMNFLLKTIIVGLMGKFQPVGPGTTIVRYPQSRQHAHAGIGIRFGTRMVQRWYAVLRCRNAAAPLPDRGRARRPFEVGRAYSRTGRQTVFPLDRRRLAAS